MAGVADVVVVGSLNIDISVQTERLPRAGETVRAEGLEIGPGGKGLNQALAAARLGARVEMVGRVGNDGFAETVLAALRESGVGSRHVGRDPDRHTAAGLIGVETGSGQNAILVAPGANLGLEVEDVRRAEEIFSGAKVLLVQLEIPEDCVREALGMAREHGLLPILDPAPARELPDELLRLAAILTPNETEAEQLAGLPVTDAASGEAAGRRLRERCGGEAVVTLGAAGCVRVGAGAPERVSAPRVEAVDTTGAGDAFNGGLAAALARGEPLGAALRYAVRAGSAATLRRGAAHAMPTPRDLEAL